MCVLSRVVFCFIYNSVVSLYYVVVCCNCGDVDCCGFVLLCGDVSVF